MDFRPEESNGTTSDHEGLVNGVDHLRDDVCQDSLPVNLTKNGVSSDESDNVDSGEEDNGSFEGEDLVKHATNSLDYESSHLSPHAEDEETGMSPNAPTNDEDSENVANDDEEEGRESDYEEPKKHSHEEHEDAEASYHHHSEEEEVEKEEDECGELINPAAAEIEEVEEEEESKAIAVSHANRQEAGVESEKPSSSGDNVEQKPLEATDEKKEATFVQQSTPPRNDDVLPPTGLAKRMVEQWSNINAQKQTSQKPPSSNSDSPQYAPHTARTIVAKFSGVILDQGTPKSKPPEEPNEQWPSQGHARDLIAKFSAMRA